MTALQILIVEDSPTVRLTIRQALSQEGVPDDQVWEAGTASDAIRLFDEHHPRVVFIDISLPEGGRLVTETAGFLDFLISTPSTYEGGNQVARTMLARDPRIKIVICTGNPPDDPRVRELIKAGAFQLVQKPVRLAQIREVLRQLRAEFESGAPGAGDDAPAAA